MEIFHGNFKNVLTLDTDCIVNCLKTYEETTKLLSDS